MTKVLVKYFAATREIVGQSEESVVVPDGSNVDALWLELARRHPRLDPIRPHLRIAVNLEFAAGQTVLEDGDEVALIPPVAGGNVDHVALTDEPIEHQRVEELVTRPSAGAVVSFAGVVRDHARGKIVERLEYEVYPEMALAKLAEVKRSVEADFPGTLVAVTHRYGSLKVGDVAVVIAVSSAHRAEAFDACRATIDRIKESVPIWKKEFANDGSTWVGLGS